MSISDFLDLLPHSVTYEVFAGRNSYAKPSYGTPTTYRARVSYRQSWVRSRGNADGALVLAEGEVWLAAASFVAQPEDRLTLPNGDRPQVLASETVPDEKGTHHLKIYFK